MAKNLIIVESPTKVKTIKKFLGSSYQVLASNGHIRDLPKSRLGIDVENDYEPQYITIRGKGPLLADIKKAAKKADKIFLATDPDREGEAISWHLKHALKLTDKPFYRITFNEITKKAVKDSLKEPRDIDLRLVDAQQLRRILDRLVGYGISPLLWEKVKRGLSAGRVQSVALRLIAEREEAVNAFIPEEYWHLEADFVKRGTRGKFTAKYYGTVAKKADLKKEADVRAVMNELTGQDFTVTEVKRTKKTRRAPLPFTTSTMQQEASKQLNFGAGKTMQVAQQLYEGMNIKGRGTVGLITYLRTDSTRISEEARSAAKSYITEHFGEDYLGSVRSTAAKANVQDAHEAIRPADINLDPEVVKSSLTRDQFRLYSLIWKRFTASQMKGASFETIAVCVDSANGHRFRASTQRQLFAGFLSVYQEEKKEKTDRHIEALAEGDVVTTGAFDPSQHFTEPPAHYTEAALIKEMERLGIGRPSTYAPTIMTLAGRRYIMKERKQLFITELGEIVNKIMVEHFPDIVDVGFTKAMEDELDRVAEGAAEWKDTVRRFYPKLDKDIEQAKEMLEKVVIADEETDVVCEKCGRNMVIKYGPHGKFLACPGFPECRNSKPFLEKAGVACPVCGKDVIIRKTKRGRRYYGCEGYPDCDFVSWNEPTGERCPDCGGAMVHKGKKIVCDNKECGYQKKEA
ncbi:MAG: type I DNA topoisomerase [Eubacteriales bacterium]|nr:type I DNA topoisomerase [Eubacteriales bacterium]